MGDFYKDSQGRTRPITPKKGGGAVLVIAVAGAIAIASGGGVSGSGVVDPGTRVTSGKDAERKGQDGEAWRRLGLTAAKRALRRHVTCAAHSFGQVREFFVKTPCRSLDRVLLALGDGNGNTIVVTVAWVRMRSVDSAERLRRLADKDGTGNVSPLGGELLELAEVRFTGQHYASRRDGSLVVIAEAAPGAGRPDTQLMKDAAEVAALFPRP